MWERAKLYLSMIRFSHTIFALPFAILACVMAMAVPTSETAQAIDWTAAVIARRWIGVILCMIFARSAAMAFNRIVDANIDAKNPRTAGRHLPAGLIGKGGAIGFWLACCGGMLASCLLFLPNWLPLALSMPVLAVLMGYSYAKRFTALAHFWLGVALALSPVAAWIAIRGELVLNDPADILPALGLGLAVFLWVSGFDIIYACQDEAFDRQQSLHSVPVWLGTSVALRLAAGCHLAMVGVLLFIGWHFPQLSFGGIYLLTVAAIGGLLIWEHSIVRPNDLSRVNMAFFHANAIISIALCLVGSIDTLWR